MSHASFKYVILDTGQVVVGSEHVFHYDLVKGKEGKVAGAGFYMLEADGAVRVFGGSYGYNIQADPADAALIQKHLDSLPK